MPVRPAVWLVTGFLAMALFAASRSTLWDRDEARFAQAAGEMAAQRRYLYPTFDGQLRPDKPILPYWSMAAAMRLFGRNEMAARAPSIAASAGALLATGAAAAAIAGPGAAGWAMAILATSPLFLLESAAATADALLLFFVAAAFLAFTRLVQTRGAAGWAAALLFAAAGALLTKGPIGLAWVALGAGTTLFLARNGGVPLGRIAALSAAAIAGAIAIFAAWFLPANAATRGAYLAGGWGRHVVARALTPMEGHGGRFLPSLFFYAPVLLVAFSPWLLHLPGAAAAAGRRAIGGDAGRALLIGWSLPGFVFLSLVATKLPHYILPLFPPLAVAVAATIASPEASGRAPRAGILLFAPIAAAEALLACAGAARLPAPLATLAMPLAVVVAATASAAILRHRVSDARGSASALVAGVAVGVLFVAALVLPALERFKPVPALARTIREATAANAPVATFEFAEPSLDFYVDRSPIERLDSPGDVVAWCARPGSGVLVTTREALLRVPDLRRLPLARLASAFGFNYSKGRWVEIFALSRERR